jgi:hypothetical protein
MEGVAGERSRRRSREYSDEVDEAKAEDLTAAELVREKLRNREVSESDEQSEVSAKETLKQVIREVQEEEGKEGEVSRKLGEVLDELEREELESKSTEERLKEALEDLDDHLEKNETRNDANEDLSNKESRIQEIPKDVVDESFKTIRESESLDAEAVADAIEELIRNTSDMENRLKVADLSQSRMESEQLVKIEEILEKEKESIRESLAEKLEENTRVGVVDEKLYIWTPDKNPNDMINGWRTQYFYMDKEVLTELIDETSSNLELDDTEKFNSLIQQITSESKYKQFNIDCNQPRITGESLNFVRDVMSMEMKDLEDKVHKVTGANGHGGIRNPKFPEGQELEKLRARLMATAVSDCYVRPDGMLDYYEENLERIERFKKETLHGFGDFDKEPKFVKKHGYYRLKVSSPYGRALNEWGIPTGDRTILNYGLPSETDSWSVESRRAYMQDLISEEGHIAKGKIRWTRSNALHAGKKDVAYQFEPRISRSEIGLIKRKSQSYSGDYYGEHTLRWTELKKLRNDEDPKIATQADALYKTIRENRNRLIDDECKLAERVGLKAKVDPEEVVYYENSGRVSVKWEARTVGTESMIRWALMCPPNHPEKEVVLKKWLSKRKSEDVRKVVEELEREGMEIDSDWRGYEE